MKQTVTVEPASGEETEDLTLSKLLRDFKLARDYAKDNYWGTWDDCWALYNNKRIRQAYNGVSDTFIPIVFSTVESILSNVAGGKPKFQYLPTRPDQERDTKVLNQLADHYWNKNRMSLKAVNWIRDVINFGNGILMVGWEDGGPKFKNVPLKDYFVDPTASDPYDAKYAGFRYLTTLDELKSKKVANIDYSESDPTSERLTPLYKDLEKIPLNNASDEDTDKESKDMFNGSTIGAEAKNAQVEVIYFAYLDKIYEVANRSVVIREEETPFKREARKLTQTKSIDHPELGADPIELKIPVSSPEIKPFLPFIHMRNYSDASLVYGRGDVENIRDMQEDLNDTTNMKRDNLHYVVNQMFTIDPEFAEMAPEIESIPGAVYPLPDGALRPIEAGNIGADADNESMRLKQDIREATAADEIVKGLAQDKGDATATEIKAHLNQAGQRFDLKLQTLEGEGYAQLADKLFKLVQIFINKGQIVRTLGKAGVDFVEFNPEDFFGEYEPKVTLDTTAKAERQAISDRYSQMGETFMGNPDINQRSLTQLVAEKVFDLDDDEVQQLMMPLGGAGADPSADPAAMGAHPAAGAPPTGGSPSDGGSGEGDVHPLVKIFETINFKDLPEDAKHSLLQQLGIESEMLTPAGQEQAHKEMTMQQGIQDQIAAAADPNTDISGNPIGDPNEAQASPSNGG